MNTAMEVAPQIGIAACVGLGVARATRSVRCRRARALSVPEKHTIRVAARTGLHGPEPRGA